MRQNCKYTTPQYCLLVASKKRKIDYINLQF
jgi:hypothetical protein